MFQVLSFDHEKIMMTLSIDGKLVIRKKTVEKEYRNILLARQHILKHQPVLVSETYGTIRVLVADVAEWNYDKQLLSTSFCEGENIEKLLRNSIGSDRNELIELIRKLFDIFKTNGFLWGDFAPRNMIWDQQQGIIWLVDFERELQLKDCPVEQYLFNRYIRNYSREEFSCFLTLHEKDYLFNKLLDEDDGGIIPANQIVSKRKRSLLKSLFIEKEYYSLNEIRHAEDIMVTAATPFLVHGVYFFPMDSLDLIGSKGGPNEYVRAIMAIRNMEEYERFSELKKRTKTL